MLPFQKIGNPIVYMTRHAFGKKKDVKHEA
jgi:hypothetical protein